MNKYASPKATVVELDVINIIMTSDCTLYNANCTTETFGPLSLNEVE